MCRRLIYILMILTLILLLAGCKTAIAAPDTAQTMATADLTISTTVPAEMAIPDENAIPEGSLPTATTETPAVEDISEPVTTVTPASDLPYLQRIGWSDQSIYSGPGYDNSFAGTVREVGIYTIVEEFIDAEGNLWGKLKSGAGWVDLTEIRSEDYENALMRANHLDKNLVLNGAYHYFSAGNEQCIPVIFRAYGKLRNIVIFRFYIGADIPIPGEDLYTLPEMTEEMPLVAELDFPGDLSMYGIRFEDSSGVVHTYHISVSGRNGALIFTGV